MSAETFDLPNYPCFATDEQQEFHNLPPSNEQLYTNFFCIIAGLLAVAVLILLLKSYLPAPNQTPSPTLIAQEEEDDYARYLLECRLETQIEHLVDSIRDVAELPIESFVDHRSHGTVARNRRNLQTVAGLKKVVAELSALQPNDACEVDDEVLDDALIPDDE